jgi:hypothetical protein
VPATAAAKADPPADVNDLLAESADSEQPATPPAPSVLEQYQRALSRGGLPKAELPPPRPSRREQLAQVAERPFVRRAMELFDVTPDKIRYQPPQGESN